jgi:hypothetical protein
MVEEGIMLMVGWGSSGDEKKNYCHGSTELTAGRCRPMDTDGRRLKREGEKVLSCAGPVLQLFHDASLEFYAASAVPAPPTPIK